MIGCPNVASSEIRFHYDLVTPFYRLLWGPHIHHGVWDGDESASAAALNLTHTLAREAGLSGGERVLDVGCGMGGSAIELAKRFNCQVTGVTLSPVQRLWAALSARFHGVGARATFLRADAERLDREEGAYDLLWSVECTEHFFDKPAFFRRASRWLAPGGRMAICAWLAGDTSTPAARRLVEEVCEGFLCPSLATRAEYAGWMEEAGLCVVRDLNWTARVSRTWELCMERVERWKMDRVSRLFGRSAALFVDRFATILAAYRTGAMEYGCFVAEKRLGGA